MNQSMQLKIKTAKKIPSISAGQTPPSIRTASEISSVTSSQKQPRIRVAKKIRSVNGMQQGGIAYVFDSNGKMKDSHPILGDSLVRYGTDVVFNDVDSLKQFVAIVAGESGNNYDEATAIAQVMMNRLKLKGAGLSTGFVSKIGGAGQFDAIGHGIYNSVMKASLTEIFNPNFVYAIRVQGAMRALGGTLDLSGSAYFWNASFPETGDNWNAYKKKIFLKTAIRGKSTFFKYNPDKKENPHSYWKTWP